MKRLTFTTLVLLLALSACASTPDTPDSDDSPASSDSTPAPKMNDHNPKPEDKNLTRSNAYLDSTDLLTLESFPLQFMLSISGNLPTPCHQLRVAVNAPDSENRIDVDVYSVTDPETMCAEVLQPFEVNVPLGSFPEGTYTLWVNGKMIAEFQA